MKSKIAAGPIVHERRGVAAAAPQPPPSADDLDRSFDALLERFHTVAARTGRVTRTFHVGGRAIAIAGAGVAPLAVITPALDHLAAADVGNAAVTVLATLEPEPGAGLQPPPPGVYVTAHGSLQMTVSADPPAVTAYDPARRLGVVWLAGNPAVHVYTHASPLRELLSLAVRPFGLVGLHAAAIGSADGGALLAGAGGAGKSTTAMTCALAGMSLVGEDFCLVQTSPTPVAHGLYNSVKLLPDAIARLHLPAAADADVWVDGKRLYFLHRTPTIKLADRIAINTVLVLRVTAAPNSRLVPVARIEAVNALAPTSVRLMGLPANAAPAVFHTAAEVVRHVRCYRLELGSNTGNIPDLVHAAIRGETP